MPGLRLPPSLALLARALILFAALGRSEPTEAAPAPPPAPDGNGWVELRSCRRAPDPYADGDSFLAVHGSKTNRFRLLFVDTPETDAGTHDQVAEQAAHFGLPPDRLAPLGEAARDFTARLLSGRFTVLTRWTQAPSRGRLPRYHAVVLVGRTNLGVELVRHGLARIHDTNPVPVSDPRKAPWLEELRAADREARSAARGGWDRRRFPTTPGATSDRPRSTPGRLDLNTAGLDALEGLPGIGPALARRIRDARPFRSVDELLRVPGIGPKTFGAISNRVMVGAGLAR
jgi:endonuclease YncB( thermonuclease family)